MARFLRGIPGSSIAYFGIFERNYDQINTPGYDDLKKKKPVGWTGVRKVFTPDENGDMGPEVVTLIQMSNTSILVGAVFGAIINGKEAWKNFMLNNQATLFANHFEAHRELQNIIIIAAGKGGFKWGWRIGAFTTFILLTNTIIAAYNGKPGFIEYIISGAIAGGLWKMNLGIKASIAGTVVGSIMGTIAGAGSMMILYLTGYSFEDMQQTQYELKKWRDDQINKSKAKTYTNEFNELIKSTMEDTTLSENLDELIKNSGSVSKTKKETNSI